MNDEIPDIVFFKVLLYNNLNSGDLKDFLDSKFPEKDLQKLVMYTAKSTKKTIIEPLEGSGIYFLKIDANHTVDFDQEFNTFSMKNKISILLSLLSTGLVKYTDDSGKEWTLLQAIYDSKVIENAAEKLKMPEKDYILNLNNEIKNIADVNYGTVTFRNEKNS